MKHDGWSKSSIHYLNLVASYMLDGEVVTRLLSVLPMLFEDIVEDDDDDGLPEPVHIPTFLEATNYPAESMKIQIKRIEKFLKPLMKN